MQKFKKLLYYGSIILPVINNIYKLVKFIVDFNQGNSEILNARKEIIENIKLLQRYYVDAKSEQEDFKSTM